MVVVAWIMFFIAIAVSVWLADIIWSVFLWKFFHTRWPHIFRKEGER